jgi:beta-xylosidase
VIGSVMLWNEPNNLSHWDAELDPDWARFGEMIALAGSRVGQVAPGLTRVLGGISPIDEGFVRKILSRDVRASIDVVAVHGFPFDWNRWHHREWPSRVDAVRDAAGGMPVWATEVGVSSLGSERLQAWAVDATLETLVPAVERVYWYALTDLPERWEACTRHRESEGSAYFRHHRMGVYANDGRRKPAAGRLAEWAARGVGVCEWAHWREPQRLLASLQRLRELGATRVRTGIGWADWERAGAAEWFDFAMRELADFDVLLTLCFTPAHAGVRPHHTSPPRDLAAFADFCEAVLRRYGEPANATPALATCA